MSLRRMSLFRAACRFRGDRKASAAVEFAFIAPLFFGLLFAILDVAMIFFAGQTMETATQAAARLILTGQAQNGNYSQTDFKNDFCKNIVALINCLNVDLDVETFNSFTNVSLNNPCSNGTYSNTGFTYSPGKSGDVVVVRAFYKWPIFVPTFGFNPSSACLTGSQYLLSSTAAFRNEPYASAN